MDILFISALIVTVFSIWVTVIACVRYSREEVKNEKAKFLTGPLGQLTVLAVLIVAGVTIFFFRSRTEERIFFNDGVAALFRSFEHATNHTKLITVYASQDATTNFYYWGKMTDKKAGFFSYEANASIKPVGLESSGGYISFYSQPFDRMWYRAVTFRLRATTLNSARADVGIRLVVDDPSAAGDRELAIYELSSLRGTNDAGLGSDWTLFEIPIEKFERTAGGKGQFPDGLDANKINKIVFFVDPKKVRDCPKATLFFSDIVFKK
jgi:hypothetical protein